MGEAMSVATIHDLGTAPRGTRPVRPVPQPVDRPASVTVTVRIDLPDGRLPAGAADLVASLRALAGAGPDTVAGQAPAAGRASVSGRAVPTRSAAVADGPEDEGVLRVFLASRVVMQGGVPVRLTRREFDLLAFFCDHPRQVFDRPQLLRQVWGYEMVSGERTVDVHVRRLRIKLGGPGPLITTVRGVGYRLDEAARVAVVAGPE
jgi:two-component system, OmpR family, response regulator